MVDILQSEEIWIPVKGYEDYYEVSNEGRVRSKRRSIVYKDGTIRVRNGGVLSPGWTNAGYLFVCLHKGNKPNRRLIHRLVYDNFYGLKEGFVIDHIDHNKKNNNLSNLRQISHRDNICHRSIPGTSKHDGVWYQKSRNKWASSIRINNKVIWLGRFNSELQASNAYQTAKTSLL